MISMLKHILLIGLITGIVTSSAIAQKKKKARVRVEYNKSYNNSGKLVATLVVKEKRYVPLSDAEILFYSVIDTSRVLLDKIRTDVSGKAIFTLKDNSVIYKDSLGVLTFEVDYNGTSSIGGTKRKIVMKQGDLAISFFQKDSTKSIEVSATEIGLDDKSVPIEGVNILFYIKGTFSLLNFGKEKTDKNGITHIEFPVTMPGDTAGKLKIVAKIEEDKTYGTIETLGEINWGIPIQPVKEKQRGLGDTDAPLWMVYTLIILLSAVWFHYIYVIILIVKIKLAK